MTQGKRLLAAALALLTVVLNSASAQTPDTAPIPASAFYREPDMGRLALSPSGRWLAVGTAVGADRVGIVVFDTQEWGQAQQAVRFKDVDIDDFSWVNDDRLVFDVIDRDRGGGEQKFGAGLFSVRRDGTELRQLAELRNDFVVSRPASMIIRNLLNPYHRLLHVPVGGGDEVIVGETRYNAAREFDELLAKRLNVVTGVVRSLSGGAPDHVRWWRFDANGEPRVVVTRHQGRSTVQWRSGSDSWRTLAEYKAFEAPFEPHSVDADGNLYVTSGFGAAGIDVFSKFDFVRNAPSAEPMVKADGFDFSGSIVAESQGAKALGVRVVTDAETTVWFDKRMAALQKTADARLPGYVNRLSCRRCAEPDMVVLMRSWSDRDPGQVWIYRAGDESWRKVGAMRQDIVPERMAMTDFARIKARDGRDLPVWITQPAGASAQARPAVVIVHGGPWSRGRWWSWNADAQFLASRGYVVIEPEFRGSTGFGFAHFRAGWMQWGQAMQDDVTDAVQWAAKAGHIDPKRVCIAGASYGGYATLMGLIRDPELYRCGIAWVGVTDPRLMFKWASYYDVARRGATTVIRR